ITPSHAYFVLFSYLYPLSSHTFSPSFPTRRSSDLLSVKVSGTPSTVSDPSMFDRMSERTIPDCSRMSGPLEPSAGYGPADGPYPDRKSTRLNSSHVSISYAVFCLITKNLYERHITE